MHFYVVHFGKLAHVVVEVGQQNVFSEILQRHARVSREPVFSYLLFCFHLLINNLAAVYPLNLPEFKPTLRKEQGKVFIFDLIRKKYIVLTPEEWVRQHLLNFLIAHRQYPKALFRVEGGLMYNQRQKRSDILIFDRVGKPWMLIECKSPAIKLNQKAFNQVAVYNMTIGARYLAVSNGMVHFCCEAAKPGQDPLYLNDFPAFADVPAS